jgi:hypothetical protein
MIVHFRRLGIWEGWSTRSLVPSTFTHLARQHTSRENNNANIDQGHNQISDSVEDYVSTSHLDMT